MVSLCLWEGLVGGGAITKVVRRRGLGSVHSQLHGGNGVGKPWDASLEKKGMPVVRLKELIGLDQVEDKPVGCSKGAQNNGAPPASIEEEHLDLNAKPLPQVDESSKRVRVAVDGTRDGLESRRNRNNTKNVEVLSKGGRVDKGIPVHHKIDSSLHLNRTRFKSPQRSRGRMSPGTSMGPKGTTLDSPHKLNLTGSYGVLKLISKDNLVRIVNSQLQNGLSFPNKISHSRKRDLIDMDRSQAEETKIKRQDRAIAPDVHESDNCTKTLTVEPRSSTIANPHSNPDQAIHAVQKLINDLAPNSREEEKRTEARVVSITPSWRGKHYITHVASTPQYDLMSNTEVSPLTSHSNTSSSVHEGMLHPPSQMDLAPKKSSESEITVHAKEEAKENIHTAGLELSATQDPSDSVDGSHVLKLPPNLERGGRGGMDGGGMTVDTWSGRGWHGLVFQEMEDDVEKEWSPKEGSRSRRRRSWIWNQFFVIEEYAGPEPVLIGRVRMKLDSLLICNPGHVVFCPLPSRRAH